MKKKAPRKGSLAWHREELERAQERIRLLEPKDLSMTARSLCVGLPIMSLAMVWLAGECFLSAHIVLGIAAALLVLFVQGVSMPHAARAITTTWHTCKRDGWLVAAALEGSIVVLDLTHLLGPEALRMFALVTLVAPVFAIAALNIIAVRMSIHDRSA